MNCFAQDAGTAGENKCAGSHTAKGEATSTAGGWELGL